jgi:hypothetical protein
VIRLKTTGEIGIVISQYDGILHVLFDDYKVYPIRKENAIKTGKYFDLSIIWKTVNE